MQEAIAELALILNSSDDAIFKKDLDGRIQSWNPAARRLFGYSAEEIVGQSILRLVPPEYHGEEQQILQALQRGERIDHTETVRLTKDGERIAVSLTASPVCDAQGAIIGASTIVRDIGASKREQLLLEADRRKNDFMALLGHELRNPVAPICNASELLCRLLQDQPQTLSLSELIRRQARQLTRLIDDLLDVARISRGRIALECRPLRLTQIVAQGIEAAAPLLQAKHHQLSVTGPAEELYVNADPTRLIQCIANLLTNAAKYTDPGGSIQVESRGQGEVALIEVRDNGCGLVPEIQERIFDLYVQAQQTLDRSEGGLGIGLPVVKRLLELQGGSIQARSAGPGRGSTFQIRLAAVSAPATMVSDFSAQPTIPKRVFLVEDNIDGATSLSLLLRAEGHRVHAAHSAQAALHEIDAFKPDVALIDIGLPKMDGYELLEKLRLRASQRDTRFIALTGYPEDGSRHEHGHVRFDAYLVKPVDAATLAVTLGGVQKSAAPLSSGPPGKTGQW
ncbi:MAG TPA: PAS domain S-box protein [Steroidobacteraceae bacterium]|nr:PAS domain S-box protein [Steroidobacteraceae bacterium]